MLLCRHASALQRVCFTRTSSLTTILPTGAFLGIGFPAGVELDITAGILDELNTRRKTRGCSSLSLGHGTSAQLHWFNFSRNMYLLLRLRYKNPRNNDNSPINNNKRTEDRFEYKKTDKHNYICIQTLKHRRIPRLNCGDGTVPCTPGILLRSSTRFLERISVQSFQVHSRRHHIVTITTIIT